MLFRILVKCVLVYCCSFSAVRCGKGKLKELQIIKEVYRHLIGSHQWRFYREAWEAIPPQFRLALRLAPLFMFRPALRHVCFNDCFDA